jgi:EAL domain-containing protein (putative c-di-GMP-specific phosphodiesterase class I)
MTTLKNIVIIDDDVQMGDLISRSVRAMGLSCVATTDPATFLNTLSSEANVIIMDLMMPGTDGVELLRALGKQQCQASIILMSGADRRILEMAERLARELGLSFLGHLQKPFRMAELDGLLRQFIASDAPRRLHPETAVVIHDAELRRAIERDEFVVHYQPKLRIATGDVIGVEALVRWNHPERGLLFPNGFITRFEGLGLIDQMGWIVAGRALEELRSLAGQNGSLPTLSLNASVHSLLDLKFPDTLVSLLRRNALPPETVILELTESALITKLSCALDVLTRLRMNGIRLSIDDFGTGFAMMQHLTIIPATELKIDKSFVLNMHANDRDRMMVRKTIEIGHELGMTVTAEGVETIEQLNFLRDQGCDAAQGYLFCRPLPASQLAKWLKGWAKSDDRQRYFKIDDRAKERLRVDWQS